MMMNDYLHPVSYHLRNFGQYTRLDLGAATAGNITFLGANAAGKTTLANTFYPLLIDGSIATPNFNQARSSDAVAQGTKPRNTMRDKRTFNSMLLGWGPTKFAVRTGYTYMVLSSSTRKVVLGIGAHRQSDGMKSATWWFVLESADVEDLVCTDADGVSLERQEFMDANAGFGAELQVFNHWEAYRHFVALNLYGFDSGETLGKLANAFRLLASPILTGGNARFAPIPEALRLAQEPIDREQIIEPLAMTQRDLNQTIARLSELTNGVDRLQQIKSTLFWGNLNHLSDKDGLLAQHTKLVRERDTARANATAAQKAFDKYTELLNVAYDAKDDEDAKMQELRKRQAEQESLTRLRADLERQIADWQNQLTTFTRQQAELTHDQAAVAQTQERVATIESAMTDLQAGTIQPVFAELLGQSANLTELAQALAKTNDADRLASVAAYLSTKQRQLKEYQHLVTAIERTSKDVALVLGMQKKMGTAIDHRLSGRLVAGANRELHTDNDSIHEAGAATMSAAVESLQRQQQKLIAGAPDLTAFIDDSAKLPALMQLHDQVASALKELTAQKHQLELAQERLNAAKTALDKLLAEIDTDFDPEVARTQIDVLTDERDDLQIDATLDAQVADKKQVLKKLQETINDDLQNQGSQRGIQQSMTNMADGKEQELTAVNTRLDADLAVLRPFAPEDAQVDDIISTLEFVHSNGSKVRAHPFSQMAADVRNILTGKLHEQPMDALFTERQVPELAAKLHESRTVSAEDLLVIPFDIQQALDVLEDGASSLKRAVAERESGQSLALKTYLNAAALNIAQQYKTIPAYNQMLSEGIDPDGIRLEVELQPIKGSTEAAVAEAKELQATERPELATFVQNQINRLVNDPDLANDDRAFVDKAVELLDTRLWSEFKIYIYRRHVQQRELVDDSFVQSGGSGAEKAQAMVLPLLLVPKMRLRQASKPDAPHLVMFDEFADKLDPETARAFAQTIDRFGFNFIATMPSGAQTKILADGVANRAYEVLAPKRSDGKFHANQVHEVMQWRVPKTEEGDVDD